VRSLGSKYFAVLQASNFKHSGSYSYNFKCSRTGKDEEDNAHDEV
jgi:hypothetical protein